MRQRMLRLHPLTLAIQRALYLPNSLFNLIN